MRKGAVTIGLLCVISLFAFAQVATAAPGLLQTASRDGFWSNQFPDKMIMLVHGYYYWANEYADDNGNEQDINDTKIGLNLYRLIKPWHFGDHNQYQYILEGIFGFENISIDNKNADTNYNESGIINPMIYTSLGWNNESKTTHIQLGLVFVFPYGDNDIKGEDSYQIMPLIGFEQQFGPFWIDASVGYYHYFEDQHNDNTYGKDYFEVNVIPSIHFGSWAFYVQADYKNTQESELFDVDQGDSGYNFAIAPGIHWWFLPNMEANLKYVRDIDGKNELQGQGFNFRLLWIF